MKNFIADVWQHRLLILVIAFLFSGSNVSFAQSSQGPKDDIDAQRVGFITREVGLTTAEAQVFWPVYNKYRQDLELLRKGRSTELMAAKVNFDEYTNEEVSRIIENDFTYRQKELDLMKKYNEEFKKILPVKKVAKLYRADQLFKIYMIKDLKLDKTGTGVSDPKTK